MARAAGRKCTPSWAATPFIASKSTERSKWEEVPQNFSPELFFVARSASAGGDFTQAANQAWERICGSVLTRCGRREVRAGRIRLTSSEITKALDLAPDDQAVVEGALHGKGLNPVSLGRWLKERLVDAPINGRVLRSALGRENCAEFWITHGG